MLMLMLMLMLMPTGPVQQVDRGPPSESCTAHDDTVATSIDIDIIIIIIIIIVYPSYAAVPQIARSFFLFFHACAMYDGPSAVTVRGSSNRVGGHLGRCPLGFDHQKSGPGSDVPYSDPESVGTVDVGATGPG